MEDISNLIFCWKIEKELKTFFSIYNDRSNESFYVVSNNTLRAFNFSDDMQLMEIKFNF